MLKRNSKTHFSIYSLGKQQFTRALLLHAHSTVAVPIRLFCLLSQTSGRIIIHPAPVPPASAGVLPSAPFSGGLDPHRPEPLDKILAAIHYFLVDPLLDVFKCKFTVRPDDHHRIITFPEFHDLYEMVRRHSSAMAPRYVRLECQPLPFLRVSYAFPAQLLTRC